MPTKAQKVKAKELVNLFMECSDITIVICPENWSTTDVKPTDMVSVLKHFLHVDYTASTKRAVKSLRKRMSFCDDEFFWTVPYDATEFNEKVGWVDLHIEVRFREDLIDVNFDMLKIASLYDNIFLGCACEKQCANISMKYSQFRSSFVYGGFRWHVYINYVRETDES